ncbi:MAG: amidohydrolase [Candidatus Eisenbacteria bacterium]|nr:amidohydrolase [Candidatus Eisenbacteria bacterium]
MRNGRLVVRGRIRPMDRPDHVESWMLVEEGRVSGLGVGAPPGSSDSEVLDLGGATILPVLHDCHVHFLQTGLMELDADLGQARCFDDMMHALAEAARARSGGILRAHSFDPDLMSDGRYPSMAELDAVSPGTPLYVKRRDGHSSIVNSPAWALLGVPETTSGIELDDAGRPTGTLREDAHTFAVRKVESYLTREERIECFHRAAALAASRGIGVVHALAGSKAPENRDIELLLEVRDALPVDTIVYSQVEDVERVAGLGLPRIGGCLLLDGSFSSGTAALAEPYADRPGRGVLYYGDEHLTSFFTNAHSRGLQISVHALGERAIDQAIRCYTDACGDEIRDARHRIEHCELPSPKHVADIRALGISPCVQPTFEFLWGGPGGMIEKRLGRERAARTNPHRTMLKEGIPLAGGSDSYVTSMDSLLGIHSAVNRPNAAERLSVFDAIGLFTSGAARISFDESRRGTLEPGKDASFTVLERDPFDVPEDEIRDIEVTGLFMKGERVPVPQAQ